MTPPEQESGPEVHEADAGSPSATASARSASGRGWPRRARSARRRGLRGLRAAHHRAGAASRSPRSAEAAAEVLHVPAGPVPEAAAAVRESVGTGAARGLGGGRVVDAAKAIAGADDLRVAAIPTTLAGSSFTPSTACPPGSTGWSLVRPALVVADPRLMASLPEEPLAATAMNALAHAAESLYAPGANPVAEARGAAGGGAVRPRRWRPGASARGPGPGRPARRLRDRHHGLRRAPRALPDDRARGRHSPRADQRGDAASHARGSWHRARPSRCAAWRRRWAATGAGGLGRRGDPGRQVGCHLAWRPSASIGTRWTRSWRRRTEHPVLAAADAGPRPPSCTGWWSRRSSAPPRPSRIGACRNRSKDAS